MIINSTPRNANLNDVTEKEENYKLQSPSLLPFSTWVRAARFSYSLSPRFLCRCVNELKTGVADSADKETNDTTKKKKKKPVVYCATKANRLLSGVRRLIPSSACHSLSAFRWTGSLEAAGILMTARE